MTALRLGATPGVFGIVPKLVADHDDDSRAELRLLGEDLDVAAEWSATSRAAEFFGLSAHTWRGVPCALGRVAAVAAGEAPRLQLLHHPAGRACLPPGVEDADRDLLGPDLLALGDVAVLALLLVFSTSGSVGRSAVSALMPTRMPTRQSMTRTPRVAASGPVNPSALHDQDPGVQHVALLERRPERPVQAVLEVELAAPLDDVGEQVAVERGVLVEEGGEVEGVLGGDQLVEPHLARRHLGPVAGASARARGRAGLADALEDHGRRL